MSARMIQRHGLIGPDGEFVQLGSSLTRDTAANDGWFQMDRTIAREMARRPQAKLISGGIQYQSHPSAEPELSGVVCQMIWELA